MRIKSRVIITIVFVGIGLILAAIPQNKSVPFKLGPEELIDAANNRDIYYTTTEVAEILVNKEPLIRFIDVREKDEFEKYALPGAINIPFTEILSDEYADILNQDDFVNIFYCNGTVTSLKAWMITKQLGWENNYIMDGGLNYWVESILKPKQPSALLPREAIAKYQFSKGAGQAMSREVSIQAETPVEPVVPKIPIKRKAKKKRVQGGC